MDAVMTTDATTEVTDQTPIYRDGDHIVLKPGMYKEALDVQNACNLSGVVRSFSGAMLLIWDELRAQPGGAPGTDAANRHPVAILYANQVSFLTTGNCIDFGQYAEAAAICRRRAALGK